MSGAMSRRKGATAERTLLALLTADLQIDPPLRRNLAQARADGGADSEAHLFPWAVEVKNRKELKRPTWWQQAIEQAEAVNKLPALFYRVGKPRGADERDAWMAVLPMNMAGLGAERPVFGHSRTGSNYYGQPLPYRNAVMRMRAHRAAA